MVNEKASINFRLLASFKKGKNALIAQTKTKGKKQKRLYKKKDVGIYCYILYHQDGAIYSYENNTKNYKLVENLDFELLNCLIEGVSGQKMKVILEPGENMIVNIVSIDENFEWSAKLKKGFYEIKDVSW